MARMAHTRSASRGFTLIELLVGISILSMLALLSWRALDGMTRTHTLTQQRADGMLRLQAALGQWQADLDAVVETGEISALDFNGQVLRMTRRDSSEVGLTSPGIRVVAWAQQRTSMLGNTNTNAAETGSQWVRWQSPPLQRRDELARAWQRAADWGSSARASGQDADSRNDSILPVIGIEQWQIFYHRGETWANPQSSVGTESPGSSAPATDLPNGIRLVLKLSEGQSLSGTLVRDWIRPNLEAGRS